VLHLATVRTFTITPFAHAVHSLCFRACGVWSTDCPGRESAVTLDENKAVVRRFITEVLVGGDVDVADEVLAPNYRNRAMGVDRSGFKAFIANSPVFSDRRFDIEDLIAEGDSVVARFSFEITDPAGTKIAARGLTFYGLADGKIVEDDPITTPDLSSLMSA